MKKIFTLDALRGYAVLLVILIHLPTIGTGIVGETIKKFAELTDSGYLGVQIFFVLSGFLITRILIKEKQNNETSFKRFYIKRFLRIFPIYYLSIIIFGVLISWKFALPVALYISNYWFIFTKADSPWRPTWSLAVEEHFYLIWPLLIYSLNLKLSKTIIKYVFPSLILLAGVITVMTSDRAMAYNLMIRSTHFQILSLCVGSYLAYVEGKLYNLKPEIIYSLLTGVIALLLVGLKFEHLIYKTTTSYLSIIAPLMVLLSYTVCSTLIFILFLNIRPEHTAINIILINKPIKYVGKISYGIYLYHYSIFYIFNATYPQLEGKKSIPVLLAVEVLAITFLTAAASYQFIEKPLLEVKNKISENWFKKQKVDEAVKAF